LAGIVIGALGVIGFDSSMEATNSDEFCLSCHELADNAGKEYVGTLHHSNSTGRQVTCADCHVPNEFVPKIVRKLRGVGGIYHHFMGTIDTPERYDEQRMWMASKTWEFMDARDSRECRNCHDTDDWNRELQSGKAREYHVGPLAKGETCIDCHKGLAHKLPPSIREDEQFVGIE
jgi:cytochrome c-type protein NapC